MEKSISILPMFFLFAAIVVPAVASTHPPAQPEHIFLLAGQSNMVGHGGVRIGTDGRDHWDGYVPPRCQPDPKIFRLDRKLSWAEAVEPIHAGIFPNLKVTGIGPSMPFARHILELNANFGTLGLVPCAFDWTNMDEWSKNYTSRTLGSKPNLFRNLIGRANAAVRMGGEVAALFWWQGGKDASNYNDAIHYEEKLRNFFKDVRADLRRPDLPIIMVFGTDFFISKFDLSKPNLL